MKKSTNQESKENRIKLTKTVVEKIQPGTDKDVLVWDSVTPGFGVRVTPKGVRSYFVFYRTKDGTQRRPSLGVHGDITVEEARDKASDYRHDARHGKDPLAEKQEAREAISLNKFWDIYLRDYSEPKNKPASVATEKIHWKHSIKPALGGKKITSINRGHVERLHASMNDRPVAANRVLALLSKMFAKAADWGYVDPASLNPCRGIQKYKEEGRERYLTPDEFLKVGQALDTLEAGGLYPQASIDALRLILFTGCRRGEVLSLRWDYVDLEGGHIDLPDSKTGRKRVYLNKLALDLLNGIPRDATGWVFPGAPGEIEGNHLQELKRPWAKACKLAGIEDFHIHDARHSFASVAVALGMPLHTVGKLLGHRQSRTTQKYAHLMDDPLRAANQAIGESIEDLMSGKAKVIELRAKPVKEKEGDKENEAKSGA